MSHFMLPKFAEFLVLELFQSRTKNIDLFREMDDLFRSPTEVAEILDFKNRGKDVMVIPSSFR